MEFREKMVFLMDLTRTSNKVLADSINVDPSMISLIRTGRRGKPRNEIHIHSMSLYFSARLRNLFPDQSISRFLDRIHVIYDPKQQDLADLIFDWLSDRIQIQDDRSVMLSLSMSGSLTAAADYTLPMKVNAVSSNVFYGDSGKIDALRMFYQFCFTLKEPSTIYITADENSDWYLRAPGLWQEMQDWKLKLASRGFHFVQILPPPGPGLFYSVLLHWLPLYTSADTDVYFYPRYRDMVYRKSLYIVPDKVIMLSQSAASAKETEYSVLSTTPEFIQANMKIFDDYKSLCQKTMIRHQDPNSIRACMDHFFTLGGGKIQKTASLSASTISRELFEQFLPMIGNLPAVPDFHEEYFEEYIVQQEQQRRQGRTIELCPVASSFLVAEGKVPVVLPGFTSDHLISYTPDTYRRHLQNIVRLLKEEPNYYFVPLPYNPAEEIILVRPQKEALMFRINDPVTVFEITQPEMLSPFYLYLIGLAEQSDYMNKEVVISRLEQLIRDLEDY